MVLGFLVAGTVTLLMQYNHGLTNTDLWTQQMLPAMPFNELTRQINETRARGTLVRVTADDGAFAIADIDLPQNAAVWLLAGALSVLVASYARMKLPSWPIHPVIFLIWGTFPSNRFAFSFLLGWLAKSAALRIGGARSVRQLSPLVVGLIVGELAAGLLWVIVGAAYYFVTARTPATYSIF